MREALSALTTRGRAFLAAGATTLLCAFLLGQDALLRVGALLILLPLATAFFVGRSRFRLGLVRSLAPAQVTAGQQTNVQLDLSNDGRMPTGLLLLEDQVPYVLGNRPRFVVDRMGPTWKRSVTYPLRSDVRGKFQVGPMRVRLSDPFGLIVLDRTFQSTSTLVVTPRVVVLPAVALSGAWTGAGDNRPRAFASGSAEDVTVREYRRGDDLRRVHWRSSAHAGELMVRREEQPWQSRATLFLDNRTFAHRGLGAASSLEHAVSLAASMAVHLVQRGFMVRLVTAGAEGRHVGRQDSWHEHGARAAESAPILESLAVLAASDSLDIDTRWLSEAGHSGLLVAVLGSITERDTAALTRMRHSSGSAMAVALDVDGWARGPISPGALSTAQNTAWLGVNGWRAVSAGPEDPLPSVWQELGSAGRTATGAGPVTDTAKAPTATPTSGVRR